MRDKIGLLFFSVCLLGTSSLEIVNQWNLANFDFPSDFDYKTFRPENTLMTGIEITDDRIFIATPSLRAGVPAALSTIPRHTPPGSSPALQPYPDWSFHRGSRANASCSGLNSVYRIKTDSCNRLWVLDAGLMTSLDRFTRVCQPKLVVFDLRTDQIVRTVVFPDDVLRPNSALTNFIIDESVQGQCDSAFFYISDTIAPGMVVYDGLKDQTWRFVHPTMYPDPDYSSYNIAGDTFVFMDGILGLAFSSKLATVYYQPLTSDKIFSVPTAALRKGPPREQEELPVTVVGQKSSQGLGIAVNQVDNTVFFSPFTETSVVSWNPETNENRVLVQDAINLQFTAEIRWKEDGSLWLLSSRFQKYFTRTVTPKEINLRIMRIAPTSSLYSDILKSRFYQ